MSLWDRKRDEYQGPTDPIKHLPDLRAMIMPYAVPRWYQTAVLFQRGMVDAVKDKEKFGNGLILKLAVGVVVGVVWLNQAGSTNKAIFPTTGALFIATTSSVRHDPPIMLHLWQSLPLSLSLSPSRMPACPSSHRPGLHPLTAPLACPSGAGHALRHRAGPALLQGPPAPRVQERIL